MYIFTTIFYAIIWSLIAKPSSRDLEESASKLLKFSETNTCVAKRISTLKDNCQSFLDEDKSKLAFALSNCLLVQSKKPEISCSKYEEISECTGRMKGDSWTTYTNFYLHIDNLCFYYKSLLWEQKTQNLINSLSSAAEQTQHTLSDILQESKGVYDSQKELQNELKLSIKTQKELQQIIVRSSKQYQKVSSRLSSTIQQLSKNITSTYQSLKLIVNALQYTINKIYDCQQYLIGEVDYGFSSLVCLGAFSILIVILGSIGGFQTARTKSLLILALYFVIQKFLRLIHLDFDFMISFVRSIVAICILYSFVTSYVSKKSETTSPKINLDAVYEKINTLNRSLQRSWEIQEHKTARRECKSIKKYE